MYEKFAPTYFELGWDQPLPLPLGKKYPPPNGATGNVADVTEAQVADWVDEYEGSNIGLRMPRMGDYEVIGIDVDHHDNKFGAHTYAGTEMSYGVLTRTWRVSSRGRANRDHGIFFYRVPAGLKWAGQVGPSVEIIQRSHRYAVVAPSTCEGRTYEWYDPENAPTSDIPNVMDLPMLHESWIEEFSRGEVRDRARVAPEDQIPDLAAAYEWMAEHIVGYSSQGGQDSRSSIMAQASDLERLREEAKDGAHDMLTARVHECVRLATRGFHGLEAALEDIKTAFMDEVLGEDNRRDKTSANSEFARSVIGEVELLRQDLEDGLAMLHPMSGGWSSLDEEEMDSIDQSIQRAIALRPATVDPDEHPANDTGHGQMLAQYWGRALRSIEDTPNSWVLWSELHNRWEELPSEKLYQSVLKPAVEDRLHLAAQGFMDSADRCRESGDDEEAAREFAKYKEVEKRAVATGQRAVMDNILKVARTEPGTPVKWNRFDEDDLILGVKNGLIDFAEANKNVRQTETPIRHLLRQAIPEDYVLLNTNTLALQDTKSAAWERYLDTFIPDLEYREFVQRVFGYAVLGHNRERLMIFLQGGTSTGKSTILEAVMKAIGDYAASVNIGSIFREKQDGGPNPELVESLTKRIITASEVGSQHHLHADVIKRMTGGDQVTSRKLYSNVVVGRVPAFTPIIATNNMPTIRGGDSAVWRRLLILPFDHTVSEGNVVHHKLTEDENAIEAVLAWLIEGALAYLEKGLRRSEWPKQCLDRAEEFIGGTSPLQSYLNQDTVRGDYSVRCDELFRRYSAWCDTEGMAERDRLTRSDLTRQLKGNGIEVKRTSTRVDGKVVVVKKYTGVAFLVDS